MQYIFPSWFDIEDQCLKIKQKMGEKSPNCIIALLRGGVIPARIFSDFFHVNLDFSALDVKLYNGIGSTNDEVQISEFYGNITGKDILIVDDIWDSGRTMRAVLDYFSQHDANSISTATLYLRADTEGSPDYHAQIANEGEWIVFPWELCEFRREFEGMEKVAVDS
jgi:hypoxanthine phosphoribosyltransferase